MTNQQRPDLIEAFIREHKEADLHTLATPFGGSRSTVRRALDQLEARHTTVTDRRPPPAVARAIAAAGAQLILAAP